eukprot:2795182-Alexandrium_andersonii.AAC.1
MSASLVGSEMCIRDRPRTPPSGLSQLASWACLERTRRVSLEESLLNDAPVSYTHLTLPTICSV